VGVGQLMRTAVEKAKPVRGDIKLGICGEHGGDPESVKFCHRIGLDYVPCSALPAPTARLAAICSCVQAIRVMLRHRRRLRLASPTLQ
jgi:pyruvate,orthophosphate dikinase